MKYYFLFIAFNRGRIKKALRKLLIGINGFNLAGPALRKLTDMLMKPEGVTAKAFMKIRSGINSRVSKLFPRGGTPIFKSPAIFKRAGSLLSTIGKALKFPKLRLPIGKMAGGAIASAMNMVFGVLDILDSTDPMRTSLSSEIMWEAKKLSATVDELKTTSEKVMGK